MDVITKHPINMGKGNLVPKDTRKPKEFFGPSADYLISCGSLAVVPPEPPKPEPQKAGDEGKADAGQPTPPAPGDQKGRGR